MKPNDASSLLIGEICVREKQYGFSDAGEINYGCQSCCKVAEPPYTKDMRAKYYTRCPVGLACSKQIHQIHYWPNCNQVKVYQCQTWGHTIDSLIDQGIFTNEFGTSERPCMIMENGTRWFEHIFQCPSQWPCVRFQVPRTATKLDKVDIHRLDDKTFYHSYFCDDQAVDQMTQKVQAGSKDKPIVCRIKIHNIPGMQPIDLHTCPSSECKLVTHYYHVELKHSISTGSTNRIVQTSTRFFSAWVCGGQSSGQNNHNTAKPTTTKNTQHHVSSCQNFHSSTWMLILVVTWYFFQII